MRILLTNLYSAQNRGDYLITLGTVRLLRKIYGDVELSGMTTSREQSLGFLEEGTRPYKKLLRRVEGSPSGIVLSPEEIATQGTLRRIVTLTSALARSGVVLLNPGVRDGSTHPGDATWWTRFRENDLILFVGGSYLDATTLRDYPLLLSHLFPAGLARRAGIRYAFLGQSIAGADQVWVRWLLRTAFSGASLLVFRENASLNQAQEQGLLGDSSLARTKVLPDLSLGLAEQLRGFRRPRSRHAPLTVGVAFRSWRSTRVNPLDGDPVKTVARALAQSAQRTRMRFRLIPFSTVPSSGPDNDLRACEELERELRGIDGSLEISLSTLPPVEDLEGLARTFEDLDFAVCVRMHAALLAAMVGVPSVMIEYRGHKAQGVSESLGLGQYYVRALTSEDLEEKIAELAATYEPLSVQVITAVESQYRTLTNGLVPLLNGLRAEIS